MADETKLEESHELEADVLAHQIDGIMFHVDAVLLYKLIGMPKMMRIHMRHVAEESDNNLMTSCHLIGKYGEIIEPAKVSRDTDLTELKYAPMETHTDKAVINQKIIQAWHEWENDTKALYEDAVKEQPDCKLWSQLHKDVEKELRQVEYMKNKYLTAKAD